METRYDRLEIDGIPTYASRSSPRYAGVLAFRTGRADETLVTSGITHLVEHLALYSFGPRQPFEINGMVRGLDTLFWAAGRPDEVADFLRRVAASLRDLPLARLKDEARVLRTEAAGRIKGPPLDFLWMRFGATGHGLGFLPELGLAALEEESVREWAAERFTAGNAVLWFTGPPPKGLKLGLPPGPRIPPPPLTPVPGVRYPAWAHGNPGIIGASFVRPRGDWLSVPLQMAGLRLAEQLRYQRGLTYDMAIAYEPVTSDTSHSAVWTSSLPEHTPAVRDAVVEVLEALARDGATEEELGHAREQLRRAQDDVEAVDAAIMNAAVNELLGYPNRDPEGLRAELAAIDGPEIARRMTAALDEALLLVPPGCALAARRFQPYPEWSAEIVHGRTFRSTSAPFPWSKGPRLVVGTEGVSFVGPEHQAVTVSYAACAAAVHRNGDLDLYGEDGFRVRVHPPEWRGGPEAVRELLDRLPPGRVIRIPEDPPA